MLRMLHDTFFLGFCDSFCPPFMPILGFAAIAEPRSAKNIITSPIIGTSWFGDRQQKEQDITSPESVGSTGIFIYLFSIVKLQYYPDLPRSKLIYHYEFFF